MCDAAEYLEYLRTIRPACHAAGRAHMEPPGAAKSPRRSLSSRGTDSPASTGGRTDPTAAHVSGGSTSLDQGGGVEGHAARKDGSTGVPEGSGAQEVEHVRIGGGATSRPSAADAESRVQNRPQPVSSPARPGHSHTAGARCPLTPSSLTSRTGAGPGISMTLVRDLCDSWVRSIMEAR